MATREQIIDALKQVVDPELGINVVDLGLIYGIDIADKYVTITMTLTTTGCPLHESMVEAVRHVAQMTELTKTVRVELVWDPPWSPERLSDAARRVLGWEVR